MENKVNDIIIKALEDVDYKIEIDNGVIIATIMTPIMEFL
jgi:hypothetical protein